MQKQQPRLSDGGIIGRADAPITPALALKLGMAVGHHFGNGTHQGIIGKDTSRSNYMIENVLAGGLLGVGFQVLLTGPIPTPGIRMLTKSMRCDVGIMITSKNDMHDVNYVCFFGPSGSLLSKEEVAKIEADLDTDLDRYLMGPKQLGRAKRIDGAQARYIEYVKRTLPPGRSFEGFRVVVDCAHGAAYQVAPTALEELGVEVFSLGVEPSGFNINQEVGVNAPKTMTREVWARRANLGIALNGDGTEIVLCDEKGELTENEQLKIMFAQEDCKEDGLAIALHVLNEMKANEQPASEVFKRLRAAE